MVVKDFRNIKINDYSYHLPEEKIARYPLPERDSSNLLIWEMGKISKDRFRNLKSYLPAGSMLVFNNTRVIHARLFFLKETGARIEIFCLEPAQPSDYQLAFQQSQTTVWKCMVGNAKRWKDEHLSRNFEVDGRMVKLRARKIIKNENTFLIEFSWTGGISFADLIEEAGELPIPPYLNRRTEPADEDTYQTVYAKTDGSVAAPTAGLHFTEDVLSVLREQNIALREVTLHVGAGTFQPVKSETIQEHSMHQETIIVTRQLVEELANGRRKIIAVGTTSVRSLESLYWLGLKMKSGEYNQKALEVDQWAPYEDDSNTSRQEALNNILAYLNSQELDSISFTTRIIIVPGYKFRIVEGMITNFHQPQSTLLLLIGAFIGEDWKRVYNYALDNNFRFLSYGDSNLYLK